jgi:hypothetical protein
MYFWILKQTDQQIARRQDIVDYHTHCWQYADWGRGVRPAMLGLTTSIDHPAVTGTTVQAGWSAVRSRCCDAQGSRFGWG